MSDDILDINSYSLANRVLIARTVCNVKYFSSFLLISGCIMDTLVTINHDEFTTLLLCCCYHYYNIRLGQV